MAATQGEGYKGDIVDDDRDTDEAADLDVVVVAHERLSDFEECLRSRSGNGDGE
ncbi:hypothetical protein LR48_Vigan07g087100 [Vigna angularis]|uniref:Uncharacterized protein n=1 Tax=Phaseolus angularis TaxID=3914 RepID=A0A0L9UX66_PHAAN|nr:hypothetical protein LR48_Vigan07g087100 [Vigna angularis]